MGTIHTSQVPWFRVDERWFLRERETAASLDEFEQAVDHDTPLKLTPIIAAAMKRLRKDMADSTSYEMFLSDIPGSASHPDLGNSSQDVIFPVKRVRTSFPSDYRIHSILRADSRFTFISFKVVWHDSLGHT